MGLPSLFRPEALTATVARHGPPIRPSTPITWLLTGLLVSLLAGGGCFLVLAQYTRKETVGGILVPAAGSTRVATLQGGTITDVFVREGDVVTAGTPIARLEAEPSIMTGLTVRSLSAIVGDATDRELAATAAQASAQAQSHQSVMLELRARQIATSEDRKHLEDALDLQRDRLRLSSETLDAGRILHEKGLFPTLQLRQREEAVIAARQALAEVQRELASNAAARSQLLAETLRAEAEARASIAAHDIVRAQIDQRQAERFRGSQAVLTAPRAGRIASLNVRAGQQVDSAHTLAIILPASGGLQAELWVPSRAAGFLQIGQSVRLMYDAFPYQKYGVGHGRVASIAAVPTSAREMSVRSQSDEDMFRVVVELSNGERAVWSERRAPGMRVSADIVLESRPMWAWLINPVISIQKRS